MCTQTSAGVCTLLGISMQFASASGRLQLTFQDAAAERIFEPYRMTHAK